MKLEDKIRDNRASFDDVGLPEGSRERFLEVLDSRLELQEERNADEETLMESEKEILSGTEKEILSTTEKESSFNDDNHRGRKSLDAVDFSRKRRLIWSYSIAAAILGLVMGLVGVLNIKEPAPAAPPTAESDLVKMRQYYDDRVEMAIINLEDVMENVDDSTKMQINAVIRELTNMGNVFAEMAPMPEDRQMALAAQVYDKKLKALELITDKINK